MVHLSRIDLNLFVVFEAIYAERGITRAGERLKLSQPAISHALARLREQLGDPLFVRAGHTMEPTPVAQAMIEPVRRAIRQLEASLNGLQPFEPATTQRTFKVGVRHMLESAVVPALIARLRTDAPGVVVSTVHHDRQTLRSSLASGELDAVVDVLLPSAPDVSARLLGSSRLVVALRAGHPAADAPFDIARYLALDHVQVTSRHTGPGLEDTVLERAGVSRNVVVRCQHHWTASQVVAATDLALTLPERYARAASDALGNRLLPFPLNADRHDVHLYWHTGADTDPGNRWFRQRLIDGFEAADGIEADTTPP